MSTSASCYKTRTIYLVYPMKWYIYIKAIGCLRYKAVKVVTFLRSPKAFTGIVHEYHRLFTSWERCSQLEHVHSIFCQNSTKSPPPPPSNPSGQYRTVQGKHNSSKGHGWPQKSNCACCLITQAVFNHWLWYKGTIVIRYTSWFSGNLA